LGWFYSAPVKPLVHDLEGEFNHLQVRGKTESGKTSYLELLTQAFGMGPSPWSASSTAFSLEQLHVGSRGPPVWIDEYKPSDMHQRNVNRLHRFMRMATKESTRTKGRPDQSHFKFRMQSPIVLSGEQQIAEAAVRRRAVQVKLSARATQQRERVAAYSRLAGETYEDDDGETVLADGVELKHHALAYYKFLASRDANELQRVWQTAKNEAVSLLDEEGLKLRGSELQGAQTVVFGYRVYNRLAEEYDLPEDERPSKRELREALKHIAENVGAGGQRREHGDEFLELAAQAANAGYVLNPAEAADAGETASYRVYNPNTTPDECLALHMPTLYPAVKRYVRDYNLSDETSLLAKNDYIDEYADLVEQPGSHVAETSVKTRINGNGKRCLHIDPHAVQDRLGAGFDLTAFGLSPADDDEIEEEADDDDGDDDDGDDDWNPHEISVTAVKDVAEHPTNYPNVQVEVLKKDRMDGENTPAAKATVFDGSTAIDVVFWDDADVVDEGDLVVIENVGTSEFDGATQLVYEPKVSTIHYISRTAGDASEEDRQDVTLAEAADTNGADDATAATDGGEDPEDDEQHDETEPEAEDADGHVQPKPIVKEAVVAAVEAKGNQPAPTESVLDELDDMAKDTAETTLESLKTTGEIQRMKGGWIPT
jgi:hypothetical protein